MDIALEGLDDEKRFYETYRSICDTVCVENVMDACEDVDYSNIMQGKIKQVTRYGGEFKTKKCCNTLFMYFNIHSNGDVDCCGCKYPPLYIGNIYQTPIKELWNGKTHQSIMMRHLQGKRKDISLCAHCSSINSFDNLPEDDLDDHIENVLERVMAL